MSKRSRAQTPNQTPAHQETPVELTDAEVEAAAGAYDGKIKLAVTAGRSSKTFAKEMTASGGIEGVDLGSGGGSG